MNHPAPGDGFSSRRRLSGRRAKLVGAGIIISRFTGLIREILLGAFLGTRAGADAFGAALRIPKMLQNLLGEGALSASFIPVYSQVLQEGDEERAGRLAGATAGLLAAVTGGMVLLGILLAGPLTRIVAPGFDPQRAELTTYLLRIMVGGVGFIVLAAWCLGVLNAHRRFFLSFVAPALWNLAIITALVGAGVAGMSETDIASAAAWGVLIGGGLQFAIQLPSVLALVPRLRLSFNLRMRAVREVLRRFWPAVAGRGVVTLSAYLDVILASLLATGAVAFLDRAQVLYLLPISVFAISVAAADLPEMSREQRSREMLTERLMVGGARVTFFLVFFLIAFTVLGRPLVAALYERVNFTSEDTYAVWLVLAAYSLGIVAAGLSRLLQNTCYAAGDVKNPARIAAGRLLLAAGGGFLLMLQLDRLGIIGGAVFRLENVPAIWLLDADVRGGSDIRRLGAVGLALGAAVASWMEFGLLRRLVRQQLGIRAPFGRFVRQLLPASAASVVVGLVMLRLLGGAHALLAAPLSLAAVGIVYLLAASAGGHPAARDLLRPVARRIWRR